MAILYDVHLTRFLKRKNRSSLFLKKNPNLTRILTFNFLNVDFLDVQFNDVDFLLPTAYHYEISQMKYHCSFLLLTNIHAFVGKGPKCTKIGSKLSIQLTAQISDFNLMLET